jgi:peptide deformylase
MAIREIVTVPAPVLRRKARKATDFGPELQQLIDDMIDTMREAPGVGLAAPQVDVPLRVIVVEYAEQDEEEEEVIPPKLYTVVNPEITRISTDTELGTEGCLSIPGYAGDVDRPLAVTIKGFNRRGQPVKIKAEGWLARIFQHEMDHLDGVLFIDRAEKVWKHEGQTSQAAVSE